MTDELAAPQEGVEEVVQTEAEQVAAPEAAESTEGLPAEATAEEDAKTNAEAEEAEKKSRSQRRREAKERQEAELRRVQAEAEEAHARITQLKQAGASLPVPKQDDFPDFEQYQAALTAHSMLIAQDSREAQRLEAEAKAKAAQAQQIRQQQLQEDEQNWASQVAESKAKYPDFEQVALGQHVQINAELAQFIKGSDVAADIAYHIGKNPELGHQLSQMAIHDHVTLARAIGRLEATVSAPKPKTVSTAPAPISPVKGGAPAGTAPENMSVDQYRKWRQAGGSF